MSNNSEFDFDFGDENDGFEGNDFDDSMFDDTFGGGPVDEDLPDIEEEERGGNRTFVIIGVLFMIVFVILSAVIAVILLGGGEECDENCQLATEITGQNQTIEAQVAATETEQSIGATETAITGATQAFVATETAVAAATATREFQDAEATRQVEEQNRDATATRVAEEDAATQTATALTPPPTETPTATPTDAVEEDEEAGQGGGAAEAGDVQGQLTDSGGQPIAGVTLCIFQDNGDGEFVPADDAPGDCRPDRFLAVGADDEDDEDATEEAEEEEGPSLNPIFATATAAAAAEAGGDDDAATEEADTDVVATEEPATEEAEDGGFQLPPTPTPEGSNKRLAPDTGARVAQQEDDEDAFVGQVVTDEDGNFVISGLPAGEYFVRIADQTLPIEVTTEEQVLTLPSDDPDAPFTVVVQAAIGTGGAGTPTPTLSPFDATGTANAGGDAGVPPSPTPEGELPTTGLFDGEGDDVTATDLLILALLGGLFIAVVMVARRMRSGSTA